MLKDVEHVHIWYNIEIELSIAFNKETEFETIFP